MQQNITASLYYELCNVEKMYTSNLLMEEIAQWLSLYLTGKKTTPFQCRDHIFIMNILLQYCKNFGRQEKEVLCKLCLQALNMQNTNQDYCVIENFRRHVNIKHMSLQQSDVSLHYSHLHHYRGFPFHLSLVLILVTPKGLGGEGRRGHAAHTQVLQKGKILERVPRPFPCSFYIADQQTHLFLMRWTAD